MMEAGNGKKKGREQGQEQKWKLGLERMKPDHLRNQILVMWLESGYALLEKYKRVYITYSFSLNKNKKIHQNGLKNETLLGGPHLPTLVPVSPR